MDRPTNAYPPYGADWLQSLLRNDSAVIKALYAEHFPAVRAFVIQNSGSEMEAQDVFQEAMSVLWLGVKEGRIIATALKDPGAYLFSVSKNKWFDTLRSADHKRTRTMIDERIHDTPTEEDRSVDDRILRLRKVYAALDDRCRNVLDQFYYEHKDLATIAASLGIGEDSVRTIKYRCMMKLRNMKSEITGVSSKKPSV